ncbi:solute carrier family 28 member 3-like isoform X2 [Mytilus galloprovincialis]|uniref:solute carrier family 28 member 3-like isoform X2 n=1 Tax=Mytilus galloprovincialis TaxID=29158 RepID=UPI003F7BA690
MNSLYFKLSNQYKHFLILYDKINWKPVIWGIVLQMVLGLLILRTEAGRKTFSFLGKQVEHFQSHVLAGVNFVFGEKYGDFEFIFKLMPTVIFINSVVSVLYHFGLMQMLVEKFAVVMHFTMGTTAAETVCTAASMFLGQPEASFSIKPYLSLLTKSELFAIMTAGFASVSADIFGLFVMYGISSSHILTAVLMSAPAGLAVSKIICPETEESQTKTWRQIKSINSRSESANVIEAAAKGAQDAMFVVLTVIACLISFLSIISFINAVLAYLGSLVMLPDLSLNLILSYVMMPLVFLMGVPWKDCKIVGEVVGLKTVVNEFVGYTKLGEFIKIDAISTKSQVIATYALCGFSNPMTMGVIVGGLSVLIPEKKNIVSEIVVRTWIAGCIACFMTACFAGLLYDEFSHPILNNATLASNYTLTTVSSYTNVSS